MRYTVEAARAIVDVDRDEWNALVERCGGTVFHTFEWLKSYEDAPPSDLFDARHLLVRDRSGDLVATVPLYHIARDPHLASYRWYGFDHELLERRMLVSHSWYSYYNGLVGSDDAEGLLPPVLDAMRQAALELDAPFYGFPGVAKTDAVTPLLRAAGFRHAYTEATSAYVVPSGGTLDDYYASLKKSRRADMRRLVNKAVREGVEVSWDRDPRFVEELGRQLREVCERHSSPLSNPPENLRSIFSNLDPFLAFLTLWYRGEMLGGFVLLEWNGVLYAWIISLNYDFNRRFGTYFVLFALMVEHAHERGVTRIEVGRGGYPMKIRLGFRPIELVSCFQATSADDDATLADGFAQLERTLRTPARIAEAYAETGIPAPARATPSVLEATKLQARPFAETTTPRRLAC